MGGYQMVNDQKGIDVFKRSIFPFFFGAFLVGLGFGNMLTQNEYLSILAFSLGGVLGFYSASHWREYTIEFTVTKRDR
jgi:hypothetical protein